MNAADGKVHFTTLQNVTPANITLPLPETSAITFQRIKVEPPEKVETKHVAKPQIFKLPTLSNTTTLTTSTGAVQTKTIARRAIAKTVTATAKPNNKLTIVKVEGTDSNTTTTTAANAGSGAAGKSDVPTCEICDKVFSIVAAISHINFAINNTKFIRLNHFQVFKRKEHLAQHVKLHLGLRPFKCEEPNCNKVIEFYNRTTQTFSFSIR